MEQTFFQHLSELRKCIIRICLQLIAGFILSIPMSSQLLALILKPSQHLIFLHPAEAFIAQLKVTFLNAVIVSLPVTLWQLVRFFGPALYPREKRILMLLLPVSFLLFCIGVVFGYSIVVPLGYKFLLSFSDAYLQPMISLESYLSFALSMILVMGFIFLTPVFMVILTSLGIVKATFLWRHQKIFIVGLLIILAIITPTVDAFSLLIVFVPLFVLMESSILLALFFEKRARKELSNEIKTSAINQ